MPAHRRSELRGRVGGRDLLLDALDTLVRLALQLFIADLQFQGRAAKLLIARFNLA